MTISPGYIDYDTYITIFDPLGSSTSLPLQKTSVLKGRMAKCPGDIGYDTYIAAFDPSVFFNTLHDWCFL